MCDNIAQTQTLCNVVQEAPDNIAPEKFLCNVALILVGQHCTEKSLCNVSLEAPDICTRKRPVQCCISTLKATLHSLKPYAMLSERLQTIFYRKNPV